MMLAAASRSSVTRSARRCPEAQRPLVHGKGSAAGEPRSQEAEEGQAEDAAGFVALCAGNERRRRARRKEEMKAKLAFGSPLYLYAERARPKLGMIQLRCVDDGLSSLRRGDLG